MWGRSKEKKQKAERRRGGGAGKGGAGLPFMGLGVPPGADESDEALEAELLALQGKSPSKGKKAAKGSKVMSMKNIDTMVAGLDEVEEESDDGEEEEGSGGEDDSELLAELREIAEEGESEDETPPTAPPPRQPARNTTPSKPSVQSPQLAAITERLSMYERAVGEAKSKGENSKVRRYTRALETIKTLQKKAQSGKSVDVDDLPPPVASGGGGGGPQPTTVVPPPPTQEVISDDELMAWANSSSGPSLEAPQPKPRPQAPPPQPKPRPRSPPTTSDGGIDLDTPEFDEFNLSDEDMAMLAAQMDSANSKPPSSQTSQPQPKPRPQVPPPQPKPRPQAPPPRPKPRPPSPPTTSDGGIDLDAPEFDEFNLSDEDLAMLAAQMESSKKQKLGSNVAPPTQSLPVALPPPGPPTKGDVRTVLTERRDQFTAAMRQAKAQQRTVKAKEFGKMAAQFNRVLKAFEGGQEVDLSQVPAPPPGYRSKLNFDLSKYKPVTPPQPSAVAVETPRGSTVTSSQDGASSESDSSVPIPKTVMEALEQRLAKYEATQRAAQEKGETSRGRRMGRIVKQYQEAIKLTRAGKPYDYTELPDPPGYPPIPAPRSAPRPSLPKPTQSLPPQRTAAAGSKFMPNPTVSHDQMNFLTKRQKELLEAVKEAKVKGDKQSALHYLKQYKGMNQMVVAASNGLRVDLSQAPPSPFADLSKTKPAASVLSHLKKASEGDEETFDRIKKQLQTQIDLCTSNAKTYEEIKNVGTATQYQNMCRELQQELLAIEGIQSQGLGPPKFTMETRKFVVVHTHTELSSEQCEIEIVKATNIPKPDGFEEKDLNVYIEIEFPWPSDDPPKTCTESVRGSSCPEFNHKEKFAIERKHSRSILRLVKRNPVKCCVWQKRTLRKHIFIGQAQLPLEKLETKCEVRASADLLDERGRKAVGGKMELIARLREPFTGRDTEEKEEQWLIFQESIAATSSIQMPRPSPTGSAPSTQNSALFSPMKIENTTSVEALKVELSLVQSAIKSGHKDPATVQKGRQIQARVQVIRQRLQSDPQFRAAYLRQVAKEIQLEQALESKLAQAGKNREAKVLQLRRQAMQQEIKTGKK